MAVPRRFSVGERFDGIPIDTLNWLVDHVQLLLADRTLPPPPQAGGGVGHYLPIDVRNTTAAAIDRYRPVGFGGPASDLTTDRGRHSPVVVSGIAAAADKPVLIYTTNCPPGEVRPAVVMGATLAWVDIKDADAATVCGIDDAAPTLLTSGTGSIPIDWFERQALVSGVKTGPQWALVRLGGGGGASGPSGARLTLGICAGIEDDADANIPGSQRTLYSELHNDIKIKIRDAINASLGPANQQTTTSLANYPIIRVRKGLLNRMIPTTIELSVPPAGYEEEEIFLIPALGETEGGSLEWEQTPANNFVPPEIGNDHVLGTTDGFVTEEGCP